MKRLLSLCLGSLLGLLLGAPGLHAQSTVVVDVQADNAEEGVAGRAQVLLTRVADIDAFEIELLYDPAAVRIDRVAPGEGFELLPQSVRVDRNGTVAGSGFTLETSCTGDPPCVLMFVEFVGRVDGPTGFGVAAVQLLLDGEPVAASISAPVVPQDPVDSLPGTRPDPADQLIQDEGSGWFGLGLWQIGLIAVIGVAAVAIVAGFQRRRRIDAMSGDGTTQVEWDGDVEGFLDHVARLGAVSPDDESSEGRRPPIH